MLSTSIKVGMKTHDLNQSQLASYLDVTRACVHKWVSGKSVPNQESQKKICELFNVTMSEFYKWGEESNDSQR